MRADPVIVIPVSDQRSTRHLAGCVAFGAKDEPPRERGIANGWIVGNAVGHAIIAIIEDEELTVGIVLSLEVADRLRDKAPSVEGGHDATHQRAHAGGGCRLVL